MKIIYIIFSFTLYSLIQIRWDDRLSNPDIHENVSIDGVDFPIFEPTPFNKKWYSFKHNGPGLRYEIGLSITTGKIIWAHGGVPCGMFSDLKLAREIFVHILDPGEKAIADRGYMDKKYFCTPQYNPQYPNISTILARHETINRRLKQWRCLGTKFRHQLKRHPMCFHSVLNITEIMIENGYPLFEL